MAEEGNLPAVPDKKFEDLVPSVNVIAPGKVRVAVPTSLASARAYAQITTARMMNVLMTKFENAGPEGMDAKTFKLFVEAHDVLSKTLLAAHGQSKKTPTEEAMNEFAQMAGGLVRNIAAGAAEGAVSGQAMRDKLAKIRSLGMGGREPKKVVEAEVIEDGAQEKAQ